MPLYVKYGTSPNLTKQILFQVVFHSDMLCGVQFCFQRCLIYSCGGSEQGRGGQGGWWRFPGMNAGGEADHHLVPDYLGFYQAKTRLPCRPVVHLTYFLYSWAQQPIQIVCHAEYRRRLLVQTEPHPPSYIRKESGLICYAFS